MVRAMERAVGGVNGLLARGWKKSTSMGHAEGGGQLEGAVDGCRGYRWRWSPNESSLWVVLGMARLSRRCPLCRWRRARDAGVVLEREDAWRRRAELEGLLESAAAQHVARSYRRCRAVR